MYTKQDFLDAIQKTSLKHEQTALLYQAGDPRIFQIQESMATMLAMFSQQIEVAMQEPFVKSRDATVLADAAMKGLIFTAQPTELSVKATNMGKRSVKIEAGRNILDSVGRHYQVLEPVTIPSESEAILIARQLQVVTQTHTVEQSEPFYAIEVVQPEDGSSIAYLQVFLNNEPLTPSYKFNGVANGDKVYHVDSDEYKRLLVRFGEIGVVGIQPQAGDNVRIEKSLSFGNVQPELGSPFSLEYISATEESDVKLEMLSIVKAGVDPTSISTLRELGRYPSIYDDNAVFLGEFEFLLRRKFNDCVFLSVWNERAEEAVRGANVDNVNKLFIAFALPSGSTLNKSSVQEQMIQAIKNADDSYRIKFVEPIIEKINVTINGSLSRIYDLEQVKKQVIDILLTHYGQNSTLTKQGLTRVKHKDIHELLIREVQAIADQRADLNVSVRQITNTAPEVYRYVDTQSITVNLTYDGYEDNLWGRR